MISTKPFLALSLLAGLFMTGARAQDDTTDKSLKKYTDLMRQDLRKEKHTIVDDSMGLEPADKAKFWGIYDGYEKELTAIWDQRLATIKQYAQNYDKMTDSVADDLVAQAMKHEQQTIAVRNKYYAQMKTALGSKNAARFVQVEAALGHLMDLQILGRLPLIQ
jgi:hypothetical protein